MADLEALHGFGDNVVERPGGLVGGKIAGDDQTLAQQIVVRPRHADSEFGVGRDRRPSAAHRQIRIAQRRFLDPLRGAFVEGRLVRQRQRRRRARFGRRCRRGLWSCNVRRIGAPPVSAEPARPDLALWPNAGAVASIVAMAAIVILRMFDALGKRRVALTWIIGAASRTNGDRSAIVSKSSP